MPGSTANLSGRPYYGRRTWCWIRPGDRIGLAAVAPLTTRNGDLFSSLDRSRLRTSFDSADDRPTDSCIHVKQESLLGDLSLAWLPQWNETSTRCRRPQPPAWIDEQHSSATGPLSAERSPPYAASAWRGGQPALGVV
jgi:hypothetical protein